MSSLVSLKPDLQDRVLTYCENNRIFLLNSRSKSGYLVAACEKARRGALDERGIGTVDPYRDYLLGMARPRRELIDLVPEEEWMQHSDPEAAQLIFDVKADPEIGVSTLRLALKLQHSVRSVKERLAAVGVKIPVQKMRLKEARVGFLRDERTLAYYNLSSGCKMQLVLKRRAGRRQAKVEASEK
ncbi:unnamed protein product [Effrenium voratum]|nr:unnamed protein product [Effrenium voratum]